MSVKSMIKRSRALLRAARGLRTLPYPLLRGLCALFNRGGIDSGAVFFACFDGMLYNDNPRAVAEALHRLRPELRLSFCLNRRGMADGEIPDYIARVPRFSLRALRAMSTSRVIVKNAAMRPWMRKFPGQYYVQTWHGDRGFKRVRLDVHPGNPAYLQEGAWMDLAVSGSDFGSRVFHSAMAVQGEVLQCGCPRNDLLLQNPPEVAARVRAALGIPEGARVLLYAPTFRNATSAARQAAPLSLEGLCERLRKTTGERWVCVTRGHELTGGIRSDARIDASPWKETGELLLACDMLITDYSSIGGDFMLLDRPVIYYQPDRSAYDAERGLYFDPDASPLIVAHSEAELLSLLSRPIDGPANCRAVLEFFGASESGSAAEAVARRISQAVGHVKN